MYEIIYNQSSWSGGFYLEEHESQNINQNHQRQISPSHKKNHHSAPNRNANYSRAALGTNEGKNRTF